MLKQLFKIMWHRKGRNFLLLTEIFFSFMVLFVTSTLIIDSLRNYYTPVGFDYTNVYELSMDRHGESKATSLTKLEQLEPVLASMPEIASYSFSTSNTPFSYNNMNNTVYAGERTGEAHYFVVDPGYFETLDLELAEGRWLQKNDLATIKPLVINETLAQELYPGESAIGKRLTQDREYEVVGVIKQYRQDGEFQSPMQAMFQVFNPNDTASYLPSKILIEVKTGADPHWQQNLVERVNKITGNWTLELTDIKDMRTSKAKIYLIPMIVLGIVCGFLIFNVALGLFGVLYYNINKRYSEIGIRRALGATERAIRWQMLGEVMVLATIGLSLGMLLALQFPLLGVMNVETTIYLLAIAASLILIFLLVALCAWYPSKQAAQIEPAMALHYE